MLDPAQREAVFHSKGPLLILAGAGSGKTRVISHRIARLVLEAGVRPEKILALTFTNKAADELGERMAKLIGKERAGRLWLSTFHGFGMRFLSEEGGAAFGGRGAIRFTLFDQADAVGLLREIIRKEGLFVQGPRGEHKLDVWALHARISFWKNKGIAPSEVPHTEVEYDAVAREAYPLYEQALRAIRAFDFDDLVLVPLRILKENPDIRRRWELRFDHILIDEFQDTNHVQLELVKLLANEERNVCVVGDDDQSIYSWRGAEVDNILNFGRDFPGARIIKLERNYRSLPSIVAVANSVIAASSRKRYPKTLVAVREGSTKVKLCVAEGPEEEAEWVARRIRFLLDEGGRKPSEIAILFRASIQARPIEEALRSQEIRYRLIGGMHFFERKEIKDALAYLRLLVDPLDELALRRIISVPPRGIGEQTISKIERWALAKGIPFAKALLHPEAISDLPQGALEGARSLRNAIQNAREAIEKAQKEGPRQRRVFFAEIARNFFRATGFERCLQEEGDSGESSRWNNVQHFLGVLERAELRALEEGQSFDLLRFIHWMSLRKEQDEEIGPAEVLLSSLHAAKGLEWPVVFMIGLNEGILPHARTFDPKLNDIATSDLEEERRLFYVGVTRARDELYLSRFVKREIRGKVVRTTPSRFLDALPQEAIEKEEIDSGQKSLERTLAWSRAILEALKGQR
ncbi:MAG: UvrD-helicase domain-containing protein [Deltaproteobacteria bacterium]|nr:UvrD-helicase domain-containing protein [Deltaproteobacteria bacterium]